MSNRIEKNENIETIETVDLRTVTGGVEGAGATFRFRCSGPCSGSVTFNPDGQPGSSAPPNTPSTPSNAVPSWLADLERLAAQSHQLPTLPPWDETVSGAQAL
jgi:hypothetical protein